MFYSSLVVSNCANSGVEYLPLRFLPSPQYNEGDLCLWYTLSTKKCHLKYSAATEKLSLKSSMDFTISMLSKAHT